MRENNGPKKIDRKKYDTIVKDIGADFLKEDFDIQDKKDLLFSKYLIKKYTKGTEFKTYNAFLVLNFIPLSNIFLSKQVNSMWEILSPLSVFIIYVFFMNERAAKTLFDDYIKKREIPYPCATWLLSGV